MLAVDSRKSHYVSRTGRAYQPGIGPFAEDAAVDLITREMRMAKPGIYDTLSCQTETPAAARSPRTPSPG